VAPTAASTTPLPTQFPRITIANSRRAYEVRVSLEFSGVTWTEMLNNGGFQQDIGAGIYDLVVAATDGDRRLMSVHLLHASAGSLARPPATTTASPAGGADDLGGAGADGGDDYGNDTTAAAATTAAATTLVQIIVIKTASNAMTNQRVLSKEMDVVVNVLKNYESLNLKYSLSTLLQNGGVRLFKVAELPHGTLLQVFPATPAPAGPTPSPSRATQAAVTAAAAAEDAEASTDGLAIGAGVALAIILCLAVGFAVMLGRKGTFGSRVEDMFTLGSERQGTGTFESVELRGMTSVDNTSYEI